MSTAAILIREMPGFTAEAQRTAARAFAARHGLRVGRVYADDGRRPRHGRQALLQDAGGVFTTLVVASTTALGQNLPEMVMLVDALRDRGVRLLVVDGGEGMVESLIAAASVLAEAQVVLRREAIHRGREKAKARGVRFGRPALSEAKIAKARAAMAEGLGVRAAARAAGISPASVVRLRAEAVGSATTSS